MGMTIRSQALGAMLGLAVGDALGAPVECFTQEQIYAYYPYGIEGMEPGGSLGEGRPAGSITDDTTMAIALAQSMVDAGGFDEHTALQAYVRWFQEDGRGIGRNTRMVLGDVSRGVHWQVATKEFDDTHQWRPVSNGGLMRCTPIGIRYHHDESTLETVAHRDAALTHYNPLSGEACAFFLRLLANALNNRPLNLVAEHSAIQEITAMNKDEVEQMAMDRHSYVLVPLACAYYAAQEYDYEEAMLWIVNLGGDADTNAAVAGALIGARDGVEVIPQEWLDPLESRDELEYLTDQLLQQSENDNN